MVPLDIQPWAENEPPRATGLRSRAQATQIDFVFSMGIRIFVLLLAVTGGMTLMASTAPDDHSGTVTAKRGANMLADDLLVADAGDTILDSGCTEAYFQMDSSTCGYNSEWSGSESTWLHESLAVSHEYRLNVTVESPTGAILTVGSVDLAMGDDPFATDDRTVNSWYRRVPLDADTDGDPETYTLYVRVWKP
jgi:hypothetical protein